MINRYVRWGRDQIARRTLASRALQSNAFLVALVLLVILTGWMSDLYR